MDDEQVENLKIVLRNFSDLVVSEVAHQLRDFVNPDILKTIATEISAKEIETIFKPF